MKICVIAGREFFYPFDQRLYKEMMAFKASGHKVTLVTPDPESGKTEIDGIPVIKVTNRGRGPTAPRMVRACKNVDCNVYHAHEFDGGYVGAVLKLLTGKHVFYDVHDDVPGLLAEIKHNPRLEKIYDKIERRMIKVMSGIVLAGDSLTKRYSRLHEHTVVVRNYPMLDMFNMERADKVVDNDPRFKKLAAKLDGNFVLGFVGGLSFRLGLIDMIEGMKELGDEKDIRLLLIGRFDREEEKTAGLELIKKYKLEDRVIIEKWIEYHKLPAFLQLVDVGLALQQPIKRLMDIPPTKLFDYMACSKPVIASDIPGLARTLKESNCGILVEPGNAKMFAEAVKELRDSPKQRTKLGKAGYEAVKDKYNWTKEGEKLVEFYINQLGYNNNR